MTANPQLSDSIAAVIESGTRSKELLDSLRSFACGGSVVTQKNLATLQAVLPKEASIKLAYGSTEAGIVFAPRPGAKVDHRYVGSLIPGTVEIRIINPDTLQDVDKNEEGELVLRGAPVFSGYYKNAESNELSHLTDATGRWYRTGDKVMFDSAREEHRITGRYKDIFKVFDGKEVSPEEVEDVLKTHESVTDAAVTARPGRRDDGYFEPVAYVVCSEAVDQQELANYVASSLSAYKSPTGGVVFVKSIPRTGFGKVSRRELEQILRASSIEYLAPVLRTAVHILVRRVQQLDKIIVEADIEVPPLNAEDDEFLERVLGTLGLSNAPPYESSAAKNITVPIRLPSEQQTFTPETRASPSASPSASAKNIVALQKVVVEDPSVHVQDYQSDFNDVPGVTAGMHTQATTQLLNANVIPGANHISPDWPFPTLDNMLNFDLFDPSDLSLHFLTEPSVDMPQQPTLQHGFTSHHQIEQASRQQEDHTSPGDEENTELVNQLSARLGSLRLAPDGKLRYFGTASNLHLIENHNKSGENFMLHTPSRVNMQRLLEVADLSQVVDIQLEDHLLRLFFTWHNPSSYIVDEEVFYMARQSWFDTGVHNSYYNDVLKDAIRGYVAQGILTVAEARARQVAFWGCYLSNLLWSFHLGRPFSMDDSEVTVPKPDPKTLPTNSTWQPYSVPSLQFVPNEMQQNPSELPDITPQIFHHWLFLCQNIAVVGHALYSYTSISKPALQELCEETTTELFHWKDSLPLHLQINTSDTETVKLPQLLMLHMEYHHLQIFLHRPWTSSQLQPQPPQGRGVHHARHICATSATEIARLLRIYEIQYSFRFINVEIIRILSSAALILIFATVPLPHREIDVEMTGYLNTCFRALEDLGGRYDSAKETRFTLLAIQRRWNDLYGKNTGQKRGPSTRNQTAQGKRARATSS
ncbi:unnamed protein product [Aureobasidium uvarum]|uniref:AMP-dependent synthetase/ligase domain-containing protein n=1 Tax=Aureobasidium uvarum TaxID=2773716 RepID=A0A9N8K839_9PEZI|nr:unnamed protein product [Aureobasidium uvarum]